MPRMSPREPGSPTNAYSWSIDPPTLYWGPKFIYERYKLPIVITENGFAGLDWVDMDGAVHDPQRIDFTRRYLTELAVRSTMALTCAAISTGR